MADSDVLNHLLEIEAEAASLVEQSKTDARAKIESAERAGRESYDARLSSVRERLSRAYTEALAGLADEYRGTLSSYAEGLGSGTVDYPSFANAARRFILKHEERDD